MSQVRQFATPHSTHSPFIGANEPRQDPQKLAEEQELQLVLLHSRHALLSVEGTSPPPQLVHTPEALQDSQFVTPQEKQVFDVPFSWNPLWQALHIFVALQPTQLTIVHSKQGLSPFDVVF